jgi:hypothetical protein
MPSSALDPATAAHSLGAVLDFGTVVFLRDGNPIHAWMAFALTDMYSLDFPHWLRAYLRNFAN